MTVPEILAAPWLGHGRATELVFTIIHALAGIMLVVLPLGGLWVSAITADLAWQGYGRFVALPFLLAAVVKGTGLYLNVVGRAGSRPLRAGGAILGVFIWTWYCAKLAVLLLRPTMAFVPLEMTLAQIIAISLCLTGSVFSVRILAMALADLPRPGSPGQM